MELRNLSTFLAVARTLSFTRAAEELNYAQSSITAQIQALEREARTHVPDSGEPTGSLTVGACEWLCADLLPHALQRYRAVHSRVQLSIRPGNCDRLRADVARGALDVAFLSDARVRDRELVVEATREAALIVIAPPDHRLAARRRVRAEEFGGEPWVLTRLACNYVEPLFEAMRAAGAAPGPMIEFASVEAIKRCVAAGVGLAVSTETAVRPEMQQGLLAEVRCSVPAFRQHVQVIRHRDKWLSPALHAFIDVAREEIARLGDLEPPLKSA